MDNTIIRNTLVESCVEVFEKMLFVEIKDSTQDTADTFKHELAGNIRFEGAYTGKLEMECSMSLAKELTVSFLGIDESEITSDKIFDNLKELVNMICGNMFCKLDEEKSVVKLGIPVCEISTPDDTDNAQKPFITALFVCGSMFDADGKEEIFRVSIYTDNNL